MPRYILMGWVLLSIIIFIILLFRNAPYGKFSERSLGKLIGSQLGFFLMEIPACLGFIFWSALFFSFNNHNKIVLLILMIIWQSAYFYRTFIYPFFRRKRKTMPLLVILFGMIFNFINTFIIVYGISKNIHFYNINWLASPSFILGSIIFFIGNYINIKSDIILSKLKKNIAQIPKGFLFSYVSSPHYLGEIIKWGGFALLLWNLETLSFFIWTLANLVPRAIAYHKWYKNSFHNYPKERKILFPKIF